MSNDINYQGVFRKNPKYLLVDWKINTTCNYNCSYCFQSNQKSNYSISKKDILNTLDVLSISDKTNIEFMIGGGEPTLSQNLKFLLKNIQVILGDRVSQLTIITNGSNTIDYYRDLIDFPTSYKKALYVSLHLNHDKFCIDKYLNKFIDIHSYDTIDYSILGIPKKFVEVCDRVSNLDNDRIISHVIPIRCGKNFNEYLKEYTYHDIDYIVNYNKIYNEVYSKHYINRKYLWNEVNKEEVYEYSYALFNDKLCFEGMYCMIGYNILRIEDNGFCRGAICYNIPLSKHSIYDSYNPFKDTTTRGIVKCKSLCCGCKDNLVIPKFRNKL